MTSWNGCGTLGLSTQTTARLNTYPSGSAPKPPPRSNGCGTAGSRFAVSGCQRIVSRLSADWSRLGVVRQCRKSMYPLKELLRYIEELKFND